ncbi:transposase [Asaia siamensis]
MRDECLNETLFSFLAQTREIFTAWEADYNTVRPYSQLGGRTSGQTVVIPSGTHHMNTELSF